MSWGWTVPVRPQMGDLSGLWVQAGHQRLEHFRGQPAGHDSLSWVLSPNPVTSVSRALSVWQQENLGSVCCVHAVLTSSPPK